MEERLKGFLERHDIFYLHLRMIRCALTEGQNEAQRRYYEYMHVHHPIPEGLILSPEEKKRQQTAVFSANPVLSIIVPLYNTPKKFLMEMIRSVQAQTYGKWELCLADGSDHDHHYVGRLCRRMGRKDVRIKYQKLEKNEGISENSNAGLRMAMGSYIGLLDHDDLLHPAALYEAVKTINDKKADLIYTDEVVFRWKTKDANRFHFKPDYSPDLLRGNNYICHFLVFSRELLKKVGGEFSPAYDGSQDYDLTLRLTEKAGNIVHIPKALYYWRNHVGSVASDVSAKPYTVEAGRRAIAAHLQRIGLDGKVMNAAFPSTYRVQYRIQGEPKISIVIPNRDHVEDLRKCLDSIREKSSWKNWEIIIVENNSEDEAVFQYYQEAEKTDERIRTVAWKGETFNFSSICNYGVSFASGEYVLLLNNDTEVITPNWLEEMLMFAQRPDVGAVGSMLYYPDDTVQHAGVILGIGMAASAHAHKGFPRGHDGYYARMSVASNLSAVTGACMMVPRRVYEEVGGLDESFRVAMNDIDFCLRIREKGYLIVFTPFAELYHYESKSRGLDYENEAKWKRFEEEAGRFRKKWAEILAGGDPYYNPNLTQEREDFSVRDTRTTDRGEKKPHEKNRNGTSRGLCH